MRTSWLVVVANALMFSRALAVPADDAPSFAQEITIQAPLKTVWSVWTTSEGYKVLGVTQADVDLRIGGLIRSHYAPAGSLGDEETIENRILAYEPQRMIAIRIHRPPKSFPFREAWKTAWTVVTLADLGNGQTHVRVASMGFGTDEESARMRKFFEAGNGATLKMLKARLEARPLPDQLPAPAGSPPAAPAPRG
jgi:uncharacterized protein YndB with AHSA1/START domain